MKTTNVYSFPHRRRIASDLSLASEGALHSRTCSKKAIPTAGWTPLMHWTLGLIWLLLGLLWPVLSWLGALDVLFHVLSAFYYANTPAMHATLQAGLHAGCYSLISVFVYLYRPTVF